MKSEGKVTIDMSKYGLTTVVGTYKSRLDWYANEYATQPDRKFGGGAGKKVLMEHTYREILMQDKYFNNSSSMASPNAYVHWQNFLEDCIIYATLEAHFSGNPVPLVLERELANAPIVSAIEINCLPNGM